MNDDLLMELLNELADYSDPKDLLVHLRTFFDGRADAEYFTDSPSPHTNHDMKILTMIDHALFDLALEELQHA